MDRNEGSFKSGTAKSKFILGVLNPHFVLIPHWLSLFSRFSQLSPTARGELQFLVATFCTLCSF